MHPRLAVAQIALATALLVAPAASAQRGPPDGSITTAGQARGVQTIRIYSANNVWLQISEVVAVERGSEANVAAASRRARASAPNRYTGEAQPSHAIDEAQPYVRPFGDRRGIYHSGVEGRDAWLEIALARPTDLSRLSLYGRLDCCAERDIYRYELRDARGQMVETGMIRADNAAHVGTVLFGGGFGGGRR